MQTAGHPVLLSKPFLLNLLVLLSGLVYVEAPLVLRSRLVRLSEILTCPIDALLNFPPALVRPVKPVPS